MIYFYKIIYDIYEANGRPSKNIRTVGSVTWNCHPTNVRGAERSMQEVTYVQRSLNKLEEGLRFYPLEGLLPVGQALSVNTTYLVVSLISRNSASGNPIRRQKLLTEPQMRLLLPLLQ